MWIDSHCHLDADNFLTPEGQDERALVVKRAKEAGISKMIVIGSGHGILEVQNAIAWAHQDHDLFAAVGVHPHDAHTVVDGPLSNDPYRLMGEALWNKIENVAKNDPKVVAIGETGLDLFYQNSEFSKQIQLFDRFLHLAMQTRKPLSLHVREAHSEALQMVKKVEGLSGVVHCFTGTVQEAKAWLDLGFFLSFSGIVTFPKAQNVQDACRFCPLNQMLLETDCPYLAPVPMRGKRNEPAYLVHTAQFVAALKNVDIENLALITTANTTRLFGL